MNEEKTIKKGAGFTQGPWTSEDCTPGESTGLCYAIKSKHTIVARTTDGWKEAQANARLIANSPAMYDMLREVESICLITPNIGEKLRELLAKVDGGEG